MGNRVRVFFYLFVLKIIRTGVEEEMYAFE